MLGLKRGTVALYDHETAWETEAQTTITRLSALLGHAAVDLQHVGSTAIPAIKAKPIIDIAVAIDDFRAVLSLTEPLQTAGFYYRPNVKLGEQLLFASGSFYDSTGDRQTHFIHVVRTGSDDWANYLLFRDYLNRNLECAKQYEALKLALAAQAPIDSGREQYWQGKHDFIVRTLQQARRVMR